MVRPLALGALVILLSLHVAGAGQAFRSDEVWSLHAVALSWPEMLAVLRADVHPPLYYFLLKFWTAVFGTGEFPVRSLSILLHFLAAGVAFQCARMLASTPGAVVCCIVFLTSPLGIVVSQLARMYTLLEFTAAASMWLWLRLMHSELQSRRYAALFVLVNIAGTFTHVWFLFYLAALAIAHVFVFGRRRFGYMAAAAVFSVLPYGFLWLPVMIRQADRTTDALAWLKTPSWSAPLESAAMQGGVVWLIAAFFLLVRRRLPLLAAPAVVWALTMLIPFAVSFRKPVFWPRFTVAALPALAVSAGSAMASAAAPAYVSGAILGTASLFSAGQAAFRSEQCDSRWTAAWLEQNGRSGDIVIFTNLSRLPIDHYLTSRVRVREISFPRVIDVHPGYEGRLFPATLSAEADDLARSASTAEAGTRVFVLHGFNPGAHSVLTEKLDRMLERSTLSVHCIAMPNYFRQISVWEVSRTPQAHQEQSAASEAAARRMRENPSH